MAARLTRSMGQGTLQSDRRRDQSERKKAMKRSWWGGERAEITRNKIANIFSLLEREFIVPLRPRRDYEASVHRGRKSEGAQQNSGDS